MKQIIDVTKVVNDISEGLNRIPAYLLIFGVCVLFFLSTTYTIMMVKTVPISLVLFFVAVLVTLCYAVKKVEEHGNHPKENFQPVEDRQLQIFQYIKILYLSEEKEKPFYSRFIKRLNQKFPVYDEAVIFQLNSFSQQQEQCPCGFRSSGIIDLRILHPWIETRFDAKEDEKAPHSEKHSIKKQSNAYLILCHAINNIQPGDDFENMAIEIKKDTKYARIVVDFSSLPIIEFEEKPKAYITENNIKTPIGLEEYSSNIYSATKNDLKKGQYLRIEWKVDWDKL